LPRAGAAERSVSLSLDDSAAGHDHSAGGGRTALLFGSAGCGAGADHSAPNDFAGPSGFAVGRAAWTFDAGPGRTAEQVFAAGRIQLSEFASLADAVAFRADGERGRSCDESTGQRSRSRRGGELAAHQFGQRPTS
jgi:hypothetical protein